MKIGHKIIIGFIPVAIVFALTGNMHIAQLNHTKANIDHIISSNLQELKAAEHINRSTETIYSAILDLQLDSLEQRQGYKQHVSLAQLESRQLLQHVYESISSLEKETISQIENGDADGEKDELLEIGLLYKHQNSLSDLIEQVFASLNAGKITEGSKIIENEVLPVMHTIRGLIRDLEMDAHEVINDALASISSDTSKGMWASTFTTLIALMAAIGLGLYLSRSISSNVRLLHAATTKLGKGKLDTRVEINSSDELGQIASDINTMATGLRDVIVSRDDLAKENKARLEAENNLQKSELKFRSIFESSRDTFMLLDHEGFFDCNDATLQMFQCTDRKTFLGHHPSELSPATQSDGTPSSEAANKHIETAFNIGHDQFEWIHQRKSGEEFPAEVLLTRLVIDGNPLLMASVRDITERKRTEAQIRESEASLRAHQEETRLLLDSTAEAIYGVNTSGNCTMVNKSCIEMLGYGNESELIGNNMHMMIHHSHADGTPLSDKQCNVYQAYKEGKATHVDDEVFWRRDKSSFPVSYWAHPIYRGDSVVGAVVTFLDITEQLHSRRALKQSREQLQTALEGTISAVAKAVGARDPYTSGHQHRVAELSEAIAREMGLGEMQIKGVYLSATIHDIGKIQLPADILSKPSKLSAAEYMLIQSHPECGYNILKDVKLSWPVADVAYQHHERIDGSGYPQGLKGDEICLEARIVAVADVVEAMSSHRPYRPGLGIDRALEEVRAHRGTSFDPVVVDACLKIFEEKSFTM